MHILQRPRIICDFETFSELDVSEVGAWAYGQHKSTEILCMSHGYPGQKKQIWIPWLMPFPQYIIDHIEAGHPIEAHNCAFERSIWYFILSPLFGVPMPKAWLDTMAACAYRGVPMSLDKVGVALDIEVKKDKRGKFLLNKLSKPQKPTKKNPSTRNNDPALLKELYDYCIRDGDAEDSLGDMLGDLPPSEFSVWVMDQRINRRGVRVDMEAVLAAIYITQVVESRLTQELSDITDGFVNSGSEVANIVQWVRMNGVNISDLQAGTIDTYMEQNKEVLKRTGKNWLPDDVIRVLEIRRVLSKASAKKLFKFRDCVNLDGRIRGLLQYHGAGTGRWAGRLVQPQNFPRGSIKVPVKEDENGKTIYMKGAAQMEYLIEMIKLRDPDILELHFGDPMAVISSALRGMFIAEEGMNFYVADFAAIEARVVMWLAGQMDALEAFYKYDRKEGPDIYCVTAGKIYRRHIDKDKDPNERQLGKITVLGCGYQMSGRRLQEQALDAYGVEISLEMADKMVETFRNDYDQVPKLWRGLEDAAIACIRHKKSTQYISENGINIKFHYVEDKAGKWMTMELPSGRLLWYNSPGLEEKEITYTDKKTGEQKTFTKQSIHYQGRDNKRGGAWGTVWTYGGMLTENAVQAIARDLMVAAMFRAEKAGFAVIMSVHDEVIAENTPERDIAEFEALIAGPVPGWAKGCPVAAEGWKGTRYRK